MFLALVPAATLCLGAKSGWNVARSAHFELYTTGGVGEARRILRHFETVQGFFAKLLDREPDPQRVRIVVFNGEKEFAPFRPNEVAAAYFWAGAGCDWIVMGDWTEQSTSTAIHEYMHLLLHARGRTKVPLWLDEGLAEVYSTLEPRGNKVMVGAMKPGRMAEVRTGAWVPVEEIVAAGHDSPLYNRKDKAGMLYGEAWLLTHMMMMEPDYGPKFPAFLRAALSGVDSAEAIRKVFGSSLRSLNEDLRGYLTSEYFRAALFDFKLEPSREKVEVEPAGDYDWRMVVAELTRDDDIALRQLEELRTAWPDRPEAPAALAYRTWRRGDGQKPLRYMTEAVDRGSSNARLLWDCARLAAGTDDALAIRAARRLLELGDSRIELKIQLARVHLHSGDLAQASAAIEGVRSVSPADAADFFDLLASLAMAKGNRKEAASSLRRLVAQENVRPDQMERARRMLSWLEKEERAPAPQAAGVELPALRDAPRPPSAPGDPARETAPPSLVRAEGRFRQLLCVGGKAWMVMDVSGRKLTFLIDEPTMVTVKGRSTGTLDLECGPQKNEPLRVGFVEHGKERQDVDGFVREVEWLQKK